MRILYYKNIGLLGYFEMKVRDNGFEDKLCIKHDKTIG